MDPKENAPEPAAPAAASTTERAAQIDPRAALADLRRAAASHQEGARDFVHLILASGAAVFTGLALAALAHRSRLPPEDTAALKSRLLAAANPFPGAHLVETPAGRRFTLELAQVPADYSIATGRDLAVEAAAGAGASPAARAGAARQISEAASNLVSMGAAHCDVWGEQVEGLRREVEAATGIDHGAVWLCRKELTFFYDPELPVRVSMAFRAGWPEQAEAARAAERRAAERRARAARGRKKAKPKRMPRA